MTGPVEPTQLFLSWAHANATPTADLVRRLTPMLALQKNLPLAWWQDSHLQPGQAWRREILTRADESHYGLLLLSPEFFASEFIRDVELPHFVGPTAHAGALPVGLSRVPLDGTWQLHGVDALQIFTLDGAWYDETRGAQRQRFVRELAGAIRRRLLATPAWRTL